jgi:lactate dehydrogenase-like 2-hydroxyacid dehydrogenase
MKPEILVITPIYAPTLAVLEREYVVRKLWAEQDPDAYMKKECGNVRGLVTTGLFGYGRRHIEALPRLEIISCFGNPHGVGAADRAAAAERKLIVTNTPDSITEPVADLALGLLVAVMRGIVRGDRFVRAGKWPAGPFPPGRGLGGKTCGIIGLGAIGKAVAKRVEPLGMTVCYHGPRRKANVTYPYYADLEAMARASDCLVVSCPAMPETRNLVNGRVLDALGPQGYLVNVARGSVVDEQALIAALKEKKIAGAGLDVYADEPNVPAELAAMEQVVLVPHIGSTTQEIREERGAKLLANLLAHFAGKPVPNPVKG